jgi:hypothetical protein
MRIVRGPASSGFARVPNAAARDKRLSYKARGILTVLLSHRDGRQIDAHSLADDSPDGRKAVLSGLRELVECGYIVYINLRGADGRVRKEMTVYDAPQVSGPSPADEQPDRGSKTAPRSDDKPAGRTEVPSRNVGSRNVGLRNLYRRPGEDQKEDQEKNKKINQSAQDAQGARWLRSTYGSGLTDFVVASVIEEARARAHTAGKPIGNLVPYLKGMQRPDRGGDEADLADVVKAAMDTEDAHAAPHPEPEPPPPRRPVQPPLMHVVPDPPADTRPPAEVIADLRRQKGWGTAP